MTWKLSIAALLMAAPLTGLAQADLEQGGGQKVFSPFDYAASGAKAEALAKAAADATESGGKVIGGVVAAQGAWPWQVALMVNGAPVGMGAQFCGGTMVLDQWVLTAAHCVHMADQEGNYSDLAAEKLAVFVGSNVIAPGQGDLVPVTGVFVHPGYSGGSFEADIALLKLARRPDANFRTINVPTEEFGDTLDKDGVPTFVTGWGLVNGAQTPERMYQADINMFDRGFCNEQMLEAQAETALKSFVEIAGIFNMHLEDAQALWEAVVSKAQPAFSENMLCSGTQEGGRTACQGDSGGPLVVPLSDGSYVQAGVVSWTLVNDGSTCEESAKFSGYTKVSSYVGWLNQTIDGNP